MSEELDQVQELHSLQCARMSTVVTTNGQSNHDRELQEVECRTNACLALVAHEMRNPLYVIANGVDLLDRIGDERAPKILGMIRRQTEVLNRMVQDLIDMARISRGTIELAIEPVDLNTVIEHAVESTQLLMETSHHELTVSLNTRLMHIPADAIRLEQVLVNLLSNAAKFTEPGGHIRLSASPDGDEVVIRIVDDGIGISTEMLPRVFDLFAQAKPAKLNSGLGIGLALVRSFVKMHGGTITVASEGIGKGSEFIVRLPALRERSGREPPLARPKGALRGAMCGDVR